MSLTGNALLTLVVVVALGAFAAVVGLWSRLSGPPSARLVLARVGSLALVNLLVVLTVFVTMNDQYLFYSGWNDLFGSVQAAPAVNRGGSASAASQALVPGGRSVLPSLPPLPRQRIGPGRTYTFTVRGRRSGLTGTVLVRVPAGYATAADRNRRYPVLETFSGYPGAPAQWLKALHLGNVLDRSVKAGRIGPVLIVSPELEFPTGRDTECVNGGPGRPQVDTWLSQDVPDWVLHTFRADPRRSAWSTIGLSAGGWCAAMVTMLHPDQFSAAVVMAGYFRPWFGPRYVPFQADSPLAAHYDLLALAQRAPPPVAVWLQTSSRDAVSYGPSESFLAAARSPLAVTAVVLPHAGHRMSVWQQQLPSALAWLGQSIAGFAPAAPG